MARTGKMRAATLARQSEIRRIGRVDVQWVPIEPSERDIAYHEYMQMMNVFYEAAMRSMFLPAHMLGPNPPVSPPQQKRIACAKVRGLITS